MSTQLGFVQKASFIHLCAGGGYWVTLDTRYQCRVDLSFSNKEPNRWFSENPELAVNFIPNSVLLIKKKFESRSIKGFFLCSVSFAMKLFQREKSKFLKENILSQKILIFLQNKIKSPILIEFFYRHLDSDFSLVASF